MSSVDQILSNRAIETRQMDHQFGSNSETGGDGANVDAGIN